MPLHSEELLCVVTYNIDYKRNKPIESDKDNMFTVYWKEAVTTVGRRYVFAPILTTVDYIPRCNQ